MDQLIIPGTHPRTVWCYCKQIFARLSLKSTEEGDFFSGDGHDGGQRGACGWVWRSQVCLDNGWFWGAGASLAMQGPRMLIWEEGGGLKEVAVAQAHGGGTATWGQALACLSGSFRGKGASEEPHSLAATSICLKCG